MLSVLVKGTGTNAPLELSLFDTSKNLAAAKASQRKVAEGMAVYTGWSPDSQRLYFQWKPYSEAREKDADTYVVNRDGSGLRKLSEEEARQAPPTNGDRSRDKTLTVFVDNGDVYVYDHASGQRRQITATTDIESNPRFTRDGKHIYFTRGGNLFMMALDAGSPLPLVATRTAPTPRDTA